MKKACLLLALSLLLLSIGCSSNTKKNTAIGLLTTKNLFVSTASTAKKLCEAGVVSPDDCIAIQSMYSRGRTLLIESKAIWDEMVEIDSFDKNRNYEKLILEVSEITVKIEAITRKYIGGN